MSINNSNNERNYLHNNQGFSIISVMLAIGILSVVSFSTIMLSTKKPAMIEAESKQSCQAAVKYIANSIIGTPSAIKSYIPFDPEMKDEKLVGLGEELNFSNLSLGNKLVKETKTPFSKLDDARVLTGVSDGPPYFLRNGLLLSGKVRALTAFHSETSGKHCNGLIDYENDEIESFANKFKLQNPKVKLQVAPYNLNTSAIDCTQNNLVITPLPRNNNFDALANLKSKTGGDLLNYPNFIRNDLGMRVRVSMAYTENNIEKECHYSKDYFQPRDINPPQITGLYLIDNYYANSVDDGGTPANYCAGNESESIVTIALAVAQTELENGTVYLCKDLSGPLDFRDTTSVKLNNPPLLDENGNFIRHCGWLDDNNPQNLGLASPPKAIVFSPTEGVVNAWGAAPDMNEWVPCERVTMCGERPFSADLNGAYGDLYNKGNQNNSQNLKNVALTLRYRIPANKYCQYNMAAVALDVAGNMSADNSIGNNIDHTRFTLLENINEVTATNDFIDGPQKEYVQNNNMFFTSFRTPNADGEISMHINSNDRMLHMIGDDLDRETVRQVKNDNKFRAVMKNKYKKNTALQNVPAAYSTFGRISKYAGMGKYPPLCGYRKRCDVPGTLNTEYPSGYLTCNQCCSLQGQCYKPDPPVPPDKPDVIDPIVVVLPPDPPIVTLPPDPPDPPEPPPVEAPPSPPPAPPSAPPAPPVVVVAPPAPVVTYLPPPPPPPVPVIPVPPPKPCKAYKPNHYIPQKLDGVNWVDDFDTIANDFANQAKYRPAMDRVITNNRWRLYMSYSTCDAATGEIGYVSQFRNPPIANKEEFIAFTYINSAQKPYVDAASLPNIEGNILLTNYNNTRDPVPAPPVPPTFKFTHGETYTKAQIDMYLGGATLPTNSKLQKHPAGGDHMDIGGYLDGSTNAHSGEMGRNNCSLYISGGALATQYRAYYYKGRTDNADKLAIYWACPADAPGAKQYPLHL